MAKAKLTLSQAASIKVKRLSALLALCAVMFIAGIATALAQTELPAGSRMASTVPVVHGTGSDTQRWKSVEGESIVSMARAMFPRDEAARNLFISRVLRANPALLRSGYDAHSPLPAGTELLVPSLIDLANVASLPRARSVSPPVQQAVDQTPPRQADVQPQSAPQAKAAPATEQDQLVIDTGGRDALASELLQGRPGSTPTEREARLVAAIDRNIDLQRELLERIKRLEEVQEEIQRRLNAPVENLPTQTLAPQAVPADTVTDRIDASSERIPDTTQTASTRIDSADWVTWTLGGLALILLALLFWQRSQFNSRQHHSYRENSDESIWPDEAKTSVGPIAKVKKAQPESNGHSPASLKPSSAHSTTSNHQPVKPASPDTKPEAGHAIGQPSFATSPAPTPGSDRKTGKIAPSPEEDIATLPPNVFSGADDSMLDDTPTAPPTLPQEDEPDEDVSAVELAELMLGFGRVDGAADALEAFIQGSPRAAVKPWLKLTEVYHKAGKQTEFEAVAANLHKTFNVLTPEWNKFGRKVKSDGIEAMPHIIERLEAIWATRECQGYIDTLIRDNRQGTRSGFPLDALDDLLMLASVLDAQLGRFRSTKGMRN